MENSNLQMHPFDRLLFLSQVVSEEYSRQFDSCETIQEKVIENNNSSPFQIESKRATVVNFQNIVFHIPRVIRVPKVSGSASFQQQKESRSSFLCRVPKLWQEYLNSGDMTRLYYLFKDVLVDDCLLLPYGCKPSVGRDLIYELQRSSLEDIPDFHAIFFNIHHDTRRIITMKCRCYGTFVNHRLSPVNIFETTPLEEFDDYHKIQKMKYDELKSQNKVIRFERTATWYFTLDRRLHHIIKIATNHLKMNITTTPML